MALKLFDRVRMTVVSGGAGNVTLGVKVADAAKGYFQTLAEAGCVNGDEFPYVIEQGSDFELGRGTYIAGSTSFSRLLIKSSTGSLLNVTSAAQMFVSPLAQYLATAFREVLQADRTYYVSPTGSDSNDGLTAGAPFLTVQKAIDTCVGLDFNGFAVTIQLANGTYTGATLIKRMVGQADVASLTIQGNSGSPASVIVSVAGNSCFAFTGLSSALIKDMTLQTTTTGHGFLVDGPGVVNFTNIRFGTVASNHIRVSQGGSAASVGPYAIVGGASSHLAAFGQGATIVLASATITLTGTPAFSGQFAYANGGFLTVGAASFSGSATGKRYTVDQLGVINTFSAGASFFPGNSAGTGTTPGSSPYGLYT